MLSLEGGEGMAVMEGAGQEGVSLGEEAASWEGGDVMEGGWGTTAVMEDAGQELALGEEGTSWDDGGGGSGYGYDYDYDDGGGGGVVADDEYAGAEQYGHEPFHS